LVSAMLQVSLTVGSTNVEKTASMV
jgi:hypothetical protein